MEQKQNNERLVVTGVVALLVLSWLGFFLHRSPRFPGSGLGTIVGVAAALLMLVPLAYTVCKRMTSVRALVSQRISLKSLMTLHVYAGLLGPLLALMHTAHKFDSWLGVALATAMLLIVISGYAVRYLSAFVTHEIKDKLLLLQTARGDLDNAWGQLDATPSSIRIASESAIGQPVGVPATSADAAHRVTLIAEAVVDLEYSIRLHELLKRWFAASLKVHIVVSVAFYALLIAHIGAAVQSGFRWWS
ncbi:hypothetical protein [Massilia suwonensis]|uniref:Iron reductase n=1 Tax=Massilia suwonensis TaxID=648895 RepID=A0ABW0MFY8_9BURK